MKAELNLNMSNEQRVENVELHPSNDAIWQQPVMPDIPFEETVRFQKV